MKIGALFVAACVAGMMLSATTARAVVAAVDTTFYFEGTCTDCVGVGLGELVVDNYTPGTSFTSSNFVSFTYTSSIYDTTPFTVTADRLLYFTGEIGPSSGPYSVAFYEPGAQFFSNKGSGGTNSNWCLGDNCFADYGPSHVWSTTPFASAAPEPSTWALMIAGLGLVGATLRSGRRKVEVLADPA